MKRYYRITFNGIEKSYKNLRKLVNAHGLVYDNVYYRTNRKNEPFIEDGVRVDRINFED